jgi:hypothetical protein
MKEEAMERPWVRATLCWQGTAAAAQQGHLQDDVSAAIPHLPVRRATFVQLQQFVVISQAPRVAAADGHTFTRQCRSHTAEPTTLLLLLLL